MPIDLNSKREEIISAAKEAFEEIVDLPTDVRPDEKERTGIQVLVRQPKTRNLVYLSIKNPSEAAQFFAVEKAVRSEVLFDTSSQNSEDTDIMRFAGSVTVNTDGGRYTLQASVSGLKAEEDVTVAISVLSKLLQVHPSEIRKMVERTAGKMPECFYDKTHYLYPFVN